MSVLTAIKPFPVVHGKYLYIFTPAEEGGFAVSCENVDGVNAQGDTFEEALECAISMTAFVEQVRADLDKEKEVEQVHAELERRKEAKRVLAKFAPAAKKTVTRNRKKK